MADRRRNRRRLSRRSWILHASDTHRQPLTPTRRSVQCPTGSVALTDRTVAVRVAREAHSLSEITCEDLGVHWLAFPARGDLVGGAQVSALGVVLPGSGGTSRRTWHRGRPRDAVPVGAAVHTLVDRGCPAESASGRDRWFVDETYVKVSGAWRHVYRAVDQHGQVIDVYVSQHRDIASARRFLAAALTVQGDPTEVITDRAPALANVIEELVPAALHNTGQYENNRVECDHGRLKVRLRSMRGLKTHRTASVVIRGSPSSRTSAGATTSSQSTPPRSSGWPLPFGELRLAI